MKNLLKLMIILILTIFESQCSLPFDSRDYYNAYKRNQNGDLVHGQFVGFGEYNKNQQFPPVSNDVISGPTTKSPIYNSIIANPNENEGGLITGQIPDETFLGNLQGQQRNKKRFARQFQFAPPGGFVQDEKFGNSRPVISTTSTPTTPSPAYIKCLANCPTTNEYNPVCGSDRINYQNSQKLSCAQKCGQRVQQVRLGTCQPVG